MVNLKEDPSGNKDALNHWEEKEGDLATEYEEELYCCNVT